MVFVFDHFGPYHVARVAAVAASMDFEVKGLELHAKSRTYGWDPSEAANQFGFEKISLPEVNLRGREERQALRAYLERTLDRCAPDVVFVNGWGDFMSLETIKWAKRYGCKLIVMSETRRADGDRSSMGEWIKGRIVRLCDAGLCGGESHRDYLAELGLPKERVSLGYNAVDNAFFSKTRTRNNGSDSPYFLASNRFVRRKNLSRLIQAYAKYVGQIQIKKALPWPLVMLGDGELRSELKELCVNLGLSLSDGDQSGDLKQNSNNKLNAPAEGGLVVFLGFRQVDEIREFYAGAGAFVHPALEEPWGLVINEAMACGLPILSSKNVGAAEELLEEGVNGFSFDPTSVEELAAAMERLAELPFTEREAMGAASKSIISHWGPERFSQGVREAVRMAMSHPSKGLGILDRLLLEILIRK
ncbi:MAG: glycosyltransferase family 4 protein [Terrimicrobiaceae bacterium]